MLRDWIPVVADSYTTDFQLLTLGLPGKIDLIYVAFLDVLKRLLTLVGNGWPVEACAVFPVPVGGKGVPDLAGPIVRAFR